jgi:hypothetical protein
MSLEQRIAFLGVALGFFAIAAPILWPDKKWLGWISLVCAVLSLLYWGWLELGPRALAAHKHYPFITAIFVFIGGGSVSLALWLLLAGRLTVVEPPLAPVTHAAPAASSKPTPEEFGIFATGSAAEYPAGTTIGGIPWSRHYTELGILLTTGEVEYRDIDLLIRPDQPIVGIGQGSGLPNVVFLPVNATPPRFEQVNQDTGIRIANPLVLVGTTAGYRMQCQKLPRHTQFEIVIAIAGVIDSPQQRRTKSVFDRDYVLRVSHSDGTVHWFGHTADFQGRGDNIYKPVKSSPKTIQFDGQYTVDGQPYKIAKSVDVRDMVFEALPRIPTTRVHYQNHPSSTLHSLSPLSDAVRFALKKKLERNAGQAIRIVRVGSDPNMTIIYEQLLDIFQSWKIETQNIAMVALAGVNFPPNPYLTARDISNPLIGKVYSDFHDLGIDLPLVPRAFVGAGRDTPEVVIVLH